MKPISGLGKLESSYRNRTRSKLSCSMVAYKALACRRINPRLFAGISAGSSSPSSSSPAVNRGSRLMLSRSTASRLSAEKAMECSGCRKFNIRAVIRLIDDEPSPGVAFRRRVSRCFKTAYSTRSSTFRAVNESNESASLNRSKIWMIGTTHCMESTARKPADLVSRDSSWQSSG